jgi:hypothetical protein
VNKQSIREGFIEMMATLKPDYCLSLNPNRDFGNITAGARRAKGERYFKHFCQLLDRATIGSRYWKHQTRRAIVVVAPEHIDTNYHLHGYLKFRTARAIPVLEAKEVVCRKWKEVIPSGTALLEEPWHEEGWSQYISKEIGRTNWFGDVLISSLYWPR